MARIPRSCYLDLEYIYIYVCNVVLTFYQRWETPLSAFTNTPSQVQKIYVILQMNSMLNIQWVTRCLTDLEQKKMCDWLWDTRQWIICLVYFHFKATSCFYCYSLGESPACGYNGYNNGYNGYNVGESPDFMMMTYEPDRKSHRKTPCDLDHGEGDSKI